MSINRNTTSKTIDHMIHLAYYAAKNKQWLDVAYYINYACSYATELNDKRLNELLGMKVTANFITKGMN